MHVVLGICGGISAYKAPELVRLLKKRGCRVTCVLTSAAELFVSKLALEVVSESKVYTDLDRFSSESLHLALAREADVLAVVPASANSLAKFSHGFSDDLLSALVLSFTKPKLLVPAMHTEMWENRAVQRNLFQLSADGFFVLGPIVGDLASGDFGKGRLADLDDIVARILLLPLPFRHLNGKRLLITAGGTMEAIDTVRAITNHSTGQMGYELARVATFMGARVTLVSTTPVVGTLFDSVVLASSVDDLSAALHAKLDEHDGLIMAAAVSDFKPKVVADKKIRRGQSLILELEATQDILKSLLPKKRHRTFIGFCLNDTNLAEVALQKLDAKGLDYIVANTSKMFGKAERDVLIYKAGQEEPIFEGQGRSVLLTAYDILSSCFFSTFC